MFFKDKPIEENKNTIMSESKFRTFKPFEIFLIVTMYILCALCLVSGILCLIFPESHFLNIIFPIFTVICIIEIILNAIFRMYNAKIGKRKIQNALEQVVTANEERNTFFANISHELRTPINIMQGMNEMIIRESNSLNISEYAKNASIAGKNLERIVNNLIIYSRISTGYFAAIDFQFDLYDFLTNYTNTLDTNSKREGFTLNHYISPGISRDTIGDNSLLGQLLDNLISIPLMLNKNATINLSFSWEKSSDSLGHLAIHAENVGIFIDEKSLYCLYNDKMKDSLNNLQGIDFNLTIIKYIVDAVKGNIDVSNSTDKGSDFYIKIPYRISGDNQLSKNIAAQHKETPTFTAPNARILVVDDHTLNIEVITMLLKRTEMKVDSATNGKDALELIGSQKYNLILIDYMMPEMDGIELLDRIKEKYPNTYQATPIYSLSASTNAEIIEKLTSCGYKGFIPKPVEGNILELVIKDNLPQHLVSETYGINNSQMFTPEVIVKFKDILAKYDIIISEGLKYMSGDLMQYYTVAQLISKNYEKNLTNIKTLSRDKNYKDLSIAVHALKGNARFIGATFLYNISMSVEIRASRAESGFIDYALPLLYYQWEKTIEGIKLFLKEFESMGYVQETKDSVEHYDGNYVEKLIEYTDNFQPEPALKLIDQILRQNLTAEQTKQLRLAAEYLEELEYDEAMMVFKEMIL